MMCVLCFNHCLFIFYLLSLFLSFFLHLRQITPHFRELLTVLNTGNPYIVSVPLEEMQYFMPWKMIKKKKISKQKQQRKSINTRSRKKQEVEEEKEEEDDELVGETESRKTLGEVIKTHPSFSLCMSFCLSVIEFFHISVNIMIAVLFSSSLMSLLSLSPTLFLAPSGGLA